MGYVALITQKVQVTKGGKTYYEIRKPGDAMPEAESWPNPALWVARGYIRADKNTVIPRGTAQPKGMRAMTPADYKAKAARRQQALETGELPPRQSTEFIPAEPGVNVGPTVGVPIDEEPLVTTEDGEPEVEAEAGAEGTPDAEGKDALLELSKKDLLKMAKKLKVDVAPAMSKDKIADAIMASEQSKE